MSNPISTITHISKLVGLGTELSSKKLIFTGAHLTEYLLQQNLKRIAMFNSMQHFCQSASPIVHAGFIRVYDAIPLFSKALGKLSAGATETAMIITFFNADKARKMIKKLSIM